MLTIRQSQMDAFVADRERRFEEFVSGVLRREMGSKLGSLSAQVLQRRIVASLTRARSYGLHEPVALLDFVLARFRMSPNFDIHPVIAAVLQDDSIPMAQRMDEVIRITPAQVWEALRSNHLEAWPEDCS